MGKLNSFQGSIAVAILKCFSAFIRLLPLKAALFIGRRIGDTASFFCARQRQMVLGHLKTAFGSEKSYDELKALTRDFYQAYGQSVVEMARLPLLKRGNWKALVDLDGEEHIDAALQQGKGCIFLSMHFGNWELSNVIGSLMGHPYNMVANDLDNINSIADFLNDLRRSAGCNIIHPGIGGREIIRRLMKNEVVTLVADQGGADGVAVPFFGRKASMSTGAVRLALKYGTPIMLVNIRRLEGGRHKLSVLPFELSKTGDDQKDLVFNLERMMVQYESWVREHPCEYVWFYKTWKYAKDRKVLIIDDGRVGHLRQSQAVARAYAAACKERGLSASSLVVSVEFRSDLMARILPFVSAGIFWRDGGGLDVLRPLLEPSSWAQLARLKPDMVISTGSRVSAVNAWVAREDRAASVAVLPNRVLPRDFFGLVVAHQHDMVGRKATKNMCITKGAPNLMDKAYLDENLRALTARYQHLRNSVRPKMAVLIGGDAKGVLMSEQEMRIVIHQIKSAADELSIDLLITTSRRTPASVEQMVVREFKDHPRTALLVVANKGNIPEAVGGMLGLADLVVVSGESVSMVSEAVSSGKKTIVFPVGPVKELKYVRFCELLSAQGHILYAGPTSVSSAINSVVKNKIHTKPINDGALLLEALRKMVR